MEFVHAITYDFKQNEKSLAAHQQKLHGLPFDKHCSKGLYVLAGRTQQYVYIVSH